MSGFCSPSSSSSSSSSISATSAFATLARQSRRELRRDEVLGSRRSSFLRSGNTPRERWVALTSPRCLLFLIFTALLFITSRFSVSISANDIQDIQEMYRDMIERIQVHEGGTHLPRPPQEMIVIVIMIMLIIVHIYMRRGWQRHVHATATSPPCRRVAVDSSHHLHRHMMSVDRELALFPQRSFTFREIQIYWSEHSWCRMHCLGCWNYISSLYQWNAWKISIHILWSWVQALL